MKHLIFCLLWLSLGILAQAQSKYAISSIPAQLLENADQVVRLYDVKFEVLSEGEAIETEHLVLTLLNERSKDEVDQEFWYDQIVKIESIEGAVYDASGKLLRKIKKKDIEDGKALEYFVNDSRVKLVRFPHLAYPYTIEYTVVYKRNGLLHYPVFYPQWEERQSVEYAKFEILKKPDLDLRIHEKNVLPNQKTGPLLWEFLKLPAQELEPFAPDELALSPEILAAPTKFRIEGYSGDMSSWQSFGKFIQELNQDKAKLPETTQLKLQQLTADCPDLYCKAQRIYTFLQENTRYYFVGLGIGGWQPMSAEAVDQFKYSDCKGLSNYTMAMLNAVGVPAYYALIRATESEQNGLEENFPNAHFNHATLCIPLPSDTIWLECTSQDESFGFLSDFTDNRPALVVFPEGGKIVHTPRYDEKVNTIQHVTQVALQSNGHAMLQSQSSYAGIAQKERSRISGLHADLQKKYLYERLKFGQFEIKELGFERFKLRIPTVSQTLSLELPNFASVSGKRLFVPLKFLSENLVLPLEKGPRQQAVQAHSRGITEEETIQITLPEGMILENPVTPIKLACPFGIFEMEVENLPGIVKIRRKLVLNNSIHPKEQFETLRSFLKSVAKADQTKLVFLH